MTRGADTLLLDNNSYTLVVVGPQLISQLSNLLPISRTTMLISTIPVVVLGLIDGYWFFLTFLSDFHTILFAVLPEFFPTVCTVLHPFGTAYCTYKM